MKRKSVSPEQHAKSLKAKFTHAISFYRDYGRIFPKSVKMSCKVYGSVYCRSIGKTPHANKNVRYD